MRITPIVEQLRARCPGFQKRVAGALDWNPTQASALVELPAAFVIPTGDEADPPATQNVVTQTVRDSIDVCVVLRNVDERGQAAADQLHSVRASLFRALVGFEPDKDMGWLEYDSGALLVIDRDRVVYRFRFVAEFTLGNVHWSGTGTPETWQEWTLAGLPPLTGVDMAVDFIDPMADKNLAPTGPDGRIELTTREDFP